MKPKSALMITLCLGLAALVPAVLAGLALGESALANAPAARPLATVPVTTTIQAAIDAAQAGDSVSIPAGTYVESLTINKSITLTGVSSATTIIQAVAGQRVISVTNAFVRLQNLQVTGGQAGSAAGGGIWADNSSVQMFSSWIVGNAACCGAGVFQGGAGSVELTASRIERNEANYNGSGIGGGIYASGDIALTDTLVLSNTAAGHGGGIIAWSGNVSVSGGMFAYNVASGDGGGLNGNNSITLHGTRFVSNTATGSGGGLSQWNAGQQVDISSSIFEHNIAGSGGALRVQTGLNAVNDLFVANSGSGGALRLGGLSGEQTLRQVTIASPNVDSGTGIYIETGAVGLTNTIIASYTTGIEQVAGTLNYDYDLFFGNGNDVTCGGTCDSGYSNVYYDDPLFATPAAGDYHLLEGSGAIDAGTDLGITSDLDGLPRPDPSTNAPDIGAYEFHSAGITGRVTATRDGSPIADAGVTLYSDRSGSVADYTYTDGAGQYSFAGKTPGTYYLEFDPGYGAGFVGEFYNNRSSLTNADAVVVVAGQTTTANAALDAYGMIIGHVTAAANSAPLADITVEAYTRTAPSSYYVTSAQTDASGVYTLSNLAPAIYYLHFNPPSGSDYAGEYYDDRPNLAYADPVYVSFNTAQTIDAALGPAGRVVGVVTGADTHLPLADVDVKLWTLNECGLCVELVGSQTTNASGWYTFTGLSSGVAYAEFYPEDAGASKLYLDEYYHNKHSGCGDAITVTLGATVRVDEDLERGGQITGRVTAADGGAGLAEVDVWLNGIFNTTTDASGYYTFVGLHTGDYTLLFAPDKSGPSAAYAWQYYDNRNRESLADPVHVAAPEIKTLNQTLVRGGWITGKVSAGDTGNGLEGWYIAVYDQDHNYLSDVDAYGNTDASGVYTTGVLPAGSYFVQFERNGGSPEYLDEYYNHKFSLLTDLQDLTAADLVNVTNGNATTLNVSLTHGGHITGRLTAADTSLPLDNMVVRVYRASDGRQLYSLPGSYTDATGVYTTGALPTSSYIVQFVAGVLSDDLDHYVSEQFYPTVGSMAEATPVAVTAPTNTTANDVIQIGGHISGRVITADTGQPSPYVGVYVQSATDAAASTIAYTATAMNGTYLTPGLWSGDYKVRFRKGTNCGEESQYYYLKLDWNTADLVHVTAPNVTPNITGVIGLSGGDWTMPVLEPVTPGSGGILVYTGRHGTVYTIEAPAGAVTEDVDLVLTPILAPAELPLGGMGYTGEVFDLDVYRNGQPVSGYSFQKAISATIHYVNADLVGRNENTFTLYRWTGHWEVVGTQSGESQTMDAAANLLRARLMGLSRFSGQATLTGSAGNKVYLPIVLRGHR